MSEQNQLCLIDGSALLYRSYYGIKNLTTSSGKPVQAVYGFCTALRSLVNAHKPAALAIAWDKGYSGREQIFKDYKAHRDEAPSDLWEQKEQIVSICKAIGIEQITIDGYEADDIIYTLIESCDMPVLIVSPDKDLRQFISPRITIYDPINRKHYDEQAVEKKYDLTPRQLPDYFALVGDSSDNIPGVKGVGDKTARSLIGTFNSLENLYQSIDRVEKERIRTLLLTDKENAIISKKLFLPQHVPGVTCSPTNWKFENRSWDKAADIFQELEFKSFIPKTVVKKNAPPKEVTHNWETKCIQSEDELKSAIEDLVTKSHLALDTETTGAHPARDLLVGISLAADDGLGYYIPIRHTSAQTLDLETVKKHLVPLLQDPKRTVVMHNAKFDLHVLHAAGFSTPANVHDTLIMADLLRTNDERIGLKYLSERLFNEPMLSFMEMLNAHASIMDVPLERLAQYAAHDAVQTHKVYRHFLAELSRDPQRLSLFTTIELPLMHVLTKMEEHGIVVNRDKLVAVLNSVGGALSTLQEKLDSTIQALNLDTISTINPHSPKQVGELLFDVLGLPAPKSSKSKARSTNREVLNELARLHPVPRIISEYRELAKLKNTYLEPLPNAINPETGRVHTSYFQTTVATGRLSSSDPNLQNIPASGRFGPQIRDAFEAAPSKLLVGADYSQIELRVLAHMTQDPVLLTAFKEDRDVHREMAAQIFNKPLEDISHDERQIGKKINFSIIYGLTGFGLSKDLGISLSEAKRYIEHYFERYAAVKPWMERTEEQAKKDGYVTTLLGRRRYFPGLQERNKALYEAARRGAINTIIQGTAAEVMKLAMIEIDKQIEAKKLAGKMLLQIHDELIVEAPSESAEQTAAQIKAIMESVIDLSVKLPVSASVAPTWGALVK
jgi:DNA polymerase-1